MATDLLEEYFHKALQRSSLQDTDLSQDTVLSRAANATLDGLRRLDGLPREHEFWKNTNKKPTIGKLRAYCQLLLQDDPNDERSLWTSVALDLWHCDNSFGLSSWRQLFSLSRGNITWLIHAAMHVQLSSGADTTIALVEFIRQSGMAEQAVSALKKACDSRDEHVARWSRQALSGIKK